MFPPAVSFSISFIISTHFFSQTSLGISFPDPYGFGPAGSGSRSVIICTDPSPDTDPNPSINKQTNQEKP
jgi:hypothetical protein